MAKRFQAESAMSSQVPIRAGKVCFSSPPSILNPYSVWEICRWLAGKLFGFKKVLELSMYRGDPGKRCTNYRFRSL